MLGSPGGGGCPARPGVQFLVWPRPRPPGLALRQPGTHPAASHPPRAPSPPGTSPPRALGSERREACVSWGRGRLPRTWPRRTEAEVDLSRSRGAGGGTEDSAGLCLISEFSGASRHPGRRLPFSSHREAAGGLAHPAARRRRQAGGRPVWKLSHHVREGPGGLVPGAGHLRAATGAGAEQRWHSAGHHRASPGPPEALRACGPAEASDPELGGLVHGGQSWWGQGGSGRAPPA